MRFKSLSDCAEKSNNFISLHWYLAIIYQPEHVLLPPAPTIPLESVSSRTRKQRIDEVDSRMSPSPVPLPEEAAATSVSPSYTPVTTEVEEIFEASCSITQDELISPSPPSDEPTLEYPESDTDMNAQGDDGEAPRVEGQHSGTNLVPADVMDVDEVGTREIVLDDTLAVSAKSISSTFQSGYGDDQPRSQSSSVPPVSFYGTGGGKDVMVPRPFPVSIDGDADVDISDDANDQNEVDELLAEPETNSPKYFRIFYTSDSKLNACAFRTFIFTLDSLGSKHPQAIRFLRAYLKFEARDKKGGTLEEYSEAVGLQAHVSKTSPTGDPTLKQTPR